MIAQPSQRALEPLVHQHHGQHGQAQPQREHSQRHNARPHGGIVRAGCQHQRVGQHRGQAGGPGNGDKQSKQKRPHKAVHGRLPAAQARHRGQVDVDHIQHPHAKEQHQHTGDDIQRAAVGVLQQRPQRARACAHQGEQQHKSAQQPQAAPEHPQAAGRCVRAAQQVHGVHRQHRQHAGRDERQQPAAQHGPQGHGFRRGAKQTGHSSAAFLATPMASSWPVICSSVSI